MDDPLKPRPIVILGPTAGGKSELAVELAQALDGEIISADSMQVYKHMNAGTAKPTPAQRRRVPHHLIDIIEPTERFTVADWLERTDALIEQLQAAQKRPIVVGGTNLYIRGLLEGLFDGPGIDPAFRRRVAGESGAQLHQKLQDIDPPSAQRIHPNDHKKLVRALEVYHLTGQPISQFQSQWDTPSPNNPTGGTGYRHQPILIGLEWPVEAINRRINLRVKAMFYPHKIEPETGLDPEITDENPQESESLLDETQMLINKDLIGIQTREALGYKQVIDHLEGRCSLDEAYEKTKILTRRFAKTQRTWLKRFRGVKWVSPVDRPTADIAQELLGHIRSLN